MFEDSKTKFIYIHDDNLGPAVRCEITTDTNGATLLKLEPPSQRPGCTLPEANSKYPPFKPVALLAATHDDVRITPDELHGRTLTLGAELIAITGRVLGLTASSRISQLSRYMNEELSLTLAKSPALLAKARLDLCELVPPMSRHIGIIRFGLMAHPLVDVLFDTTDSVTNTRAFCHVVYHQSAMSIIAALQARGRWNAGVAVQAY